MTSPREPASLQGRLRLGTGFSEADRPEVVRLLASLEARLVTFRGSALDLEISVKDRDRSGQQVTLACWLSRRTRVVATSTDRVLDRAIVEVGQRLRRQIDDAKTRTEPRNNRLLRRGTRGRAPAGQPTPNDNSKELIT